MTDLIYAMPKEIELTARVQRKLVESNGCVVYLLHFTNPLMNGGREVKHYLGITNFIERRMHEHLAGPPRGLRLVQLASQRGTIIVSNIWQNDGRKQLERWLKSSNQLSRFCPICRYEQKRKPYKVRQGAYKYVAEKGEYV